MPTPFLRYFQQGFCRDGSNCKFAHSNPNQRVLAQPVEAAAPAIPHCLGMSSSSAEHKAEGLSPHGMLQNPVSLATAGGFAFGAPGSAAFSSGLDQVCLCPGVCVSASFLGYMCSSHPNACIQQCRGCLCAIACAHDLVCRCFTWSSSGHFPSRLAHLQVNMRSLQAILPVFCSLLPSMAQPRKLQLKVLPSLLIFWGFGVLHIA